MARFEAPKQSKLIQFLQEELAISPDAIAVAMKHKAAQPSSLLPVVLWQYGLITIEQLDQVFEWLEAA